jgi:hypothetical protein
MSPFNASIFQSTARRAILALGLLATCGMATADPGYTFTRFQDPRGAGTNFFPTGINNNLVVTGTASFQTGFWMFGAQTASPGILIFDVPSAFNNATFGDDINNAGVIVGSYRNGTGGHGFVLDNGVFRTIDVPGAANTTLVTGINDAGTLVGQYREAGSGKLLGFTLTGSTFTWLDAALTQPDTLAAGINNGGRVVGTVGGGGTLARGFTFDNGVYEFFDAPGATSTQAFGINTAGQIVGTASTGLFVKDGASFTTLSLPASWNARSAFATDITDDGVVVGYFTDNNTNLTYGFLATPTAVPEPASVVLMLAGVAALAARRRTLRA